MTAPRRLGRFVVGAVLCVVPVGCAASRASAPSTTRSASPAFNGTLTVFAAASLATAFNAARSTLDARHPGLHIAYDFLGSNALVTQISQGAPADVFASADQANMARLVGAGLVERPVVFARNTLEIAVAPGNPKRISGLTDLARPGVSVVLAGPGVPAGDYTRAVESRLGITIIPRSLEPDVTTAVAKVADGEVDATVVYTTDVAAAGKAVAGVKLPAAQNTVATYPIAVVKATAHRRAAEAFVRSAVAGDVQRALEAAGFLAPT